MITSLRRAETAGLDVAQILDRAVHQSSLTTATDIVDRVEERMLADITPEDRRTLTMLLRRCVDNLEALHPPHATTKRSAHPPGDDAR